MTGHLLSCAVVQLFLSSVKTGKLPWFKLPRW